MKRRVYACETTHAVSISVLDRQRSTPRHCTRMSCQRAFCCFVCVRAFFEPIVHSQATIVRPCPIIGFPFPLKCLPRRLFTGQKKSAPGRLCRLGGVDSQEEGTAKAAG